MDIKIPSKVLSVPDGNRCVSWNTEEPSFKCEWYKDTSFNISSEDAISGGLGYSGGSVTAAYCLAFLEGLDYKYGDGVYKCDKCLKSVNQPKEPE